MIYFCIPVRDEEKTIGVVLWKIRQVMAEFPRDYQILLADDGSKDGTAKAVEPYRRVLPLIHMRSDRSRGYAASLEMLLRDAARRSRYPRRDIVVIMQADFSDDAEDVPSLLRRMESGADLVFGGPVSVPTRPGLVERLASRMAGRLLRRLEWPEPATDPLHGFTAVRLTCVRRALEGHETERLLKWEGQAANAALLAAVAPHARRIEAIEMTTHPERRQRPTRARPIPALLEVRRFVRGQPSAGLAAVDALVPDEVHGDLAALRQERSAPKPAARRRAPRKEGEHPGDRPRKDEKPRRPRRRSTTAAGPSAEGGAEATAGTGSAAVGQTGDAGPTGNDGETAPKPRRRRGARGGNRPRRKRSSSAESAESGSATDAQVDAASESDSSNAGSEPSASGEGRPKKRRRRGSRGGSGRRRTGSARNPDGASAGDPEGGSAGGPDGGSAGGSAGDPNGGSAGNPVETRQDSGGTDGV